MSEQAQQARDIRSALGHPVIDADGHWIEYGPHVGAFLERHGGAPAVDGFFHFGHRITRTVARTVAERAHARQAQESWWVLPTRNTRDRATAMMPNLMRERLDEFGIDFAVIFPTAGLGLPHIPDELSRRAACAGFNAYTAEFFGDHPDRITPAAVIPMHTPEEAVDALDHAADLGFKAVMLGSLIRRPIPEVESQYPALAAEFPWLDVLGIDSPHDYDPVWRRCLHHGLSPTFHSNGRGRAFALRASVSNFVYNHVGHFAAASEAVCKALLLGGVTHRFPELKIGFLEGGVGWACQLYCDLLGHWEKRRVEGLVDVDPEQLDAAALERYAVEYADPAFARLLQSGAEETPPNRRDVRPPDGLDDFAACGITQAEDLVRQFVDGFYFGCEADDPANAWAFQRQNLPHGERLNTLFGSDIGHFDVPDMAGVLPEAYEMVEHRQIDGDDFRAFVFENAVRFHSSNNRAFFEGTVVEAAVDEFWARDGGDAGRRPASNPAGNLD